MQRDGFGARRRTCRVALASSFPLSRKRGQPELIFFRQRLPPSSPGEINVLRSTSFPLPNFFKKLDRLPRLGPASRRLNGIAAARSGAAVATPPTGQAREAAFPRQRRQSPNQAGVLGTSPCSRPSAAWPAGAAQAVAPTAKSSATETCSRRTGRVESMRWPGLLQPSRRRHLQSNAAQMVVASPSQRCKNGRRLSEFGRARRSTADPRRPGRGAAAKSCATATS
mmetsp:Transcript_24330/g.76008  ORF Transcript_24330/g.76008 Transcript_24330/m.76008 type:complete len:225 (-) Transcript_24330:330-1004(-)